jgi:hypothetical protein
MRLTSFIAALLIFAFASAPALADSTVQTPGAQRPVSGLVTWVDSEDGLMQLGPAAFVVPADVFDLEELDVGTYAVVHFVRTADGYVATKVVPDYRPR